MFEGIVSDILVKFLGKYIKDIKADQLQLSLWNGNVVLNNLEVKGEAFVEMNLPIFVERGVVGKIELQVPWASLKSKPIHVNITDVYILCCPQSKFVYDKEAIRASERAAKQNKILTYELIREAQDADNAKDDSSSNNNNNTGGGYVDCIINNFIVNIQNIHIRYEDTSAATGKTFAFGITLDRLEVFPTDKDWNKGFFVLKDRLCHKILELYSLAVYLEPVTASLATLPTKELCSELCRRIALDGRALPLARKHYILEPIRATLRAKMNMSPQYDMEVPKFSAECHLVSFNATLTDAQLRTLLGALATFQNYGQSMKYLGVRPTVPVKGHGAEWFRYAARVVLKDIREERKRTSFAHVPERVRNCRRYEELYKRTQVDKYKWLKPLAPAEKKAFDDLEDVICIDDIIFFRTVCDKMLAKEAENRKAVEEYKKAHQPKSTSYFSFFSYRKEELTPPAPGEVVPKEELSQEQIDEIYSSVNYQETKDLIEAPPEYVKMHVSALLDEFGIALGYDDDDDASSENKRILMDSKLYRICTDVAIREKNMVLRAGIQAFVVKDCATLDNVFPQVIATDLDETTITDTTTLPTDETFNNDDNGEKEGKVLKSNNFMDLIVDMSPLDKSSDLAVKARMKSTSIVVSEPFIKKVMDFFTKEADPNVSKLAEAATGQMWDAVSATQSQLEHAIRNHQTMNLDLALEAPRIVVPQDPCDESSLLLILDLGNLHVNSDLSKPPEEEDVDEEGQKKANNNEDNEIDNRTLDKMYDKYTVEMSGIQVILMNNEPGLIKELKWRDNPGVIPLVEPFKCTICASVSICPNELKIPMLVVSGQLPAFRMNVSLVKKDQIAKIADSFMSLVSQGDNTTQQTKQPEQQQSQPQQSTQQSQSQSSTSTTLTTSYSQLDEEDKAARTKALIEHKSLIAKFVIPEISMTFYNEGRARPKRLLNVIVSGIKCKFESRTYDMYARAKIQSLAIEDLIAKRAKSAFPYMVSTFLSKEERDNPTKGGRLLYTEWRAFSRGTPSYNNQDMDLFARIGKLYVIVNPLSLAKLYRHLSPVLKEMFMPQKQESPAQISVEIEMDDNDTKDTKDTKDITNKHSEDDLMIDVGNDDVNIIVLDDEPVKTSKKGSKKKKNKKEHKKKEHNENKPKTLKKIVPEYPRSKIIVSRIRAEMDEVGIILLQRDKTFCEFTVQTMNVDLKKMERTVSLSGSLKGMDMTNPFSLTEGSLYRDIVSLKAGCETFASFSFEQLCPEEEGYAGFDTVVRASVNPLVVTPVPSFIFGVVDYVTKGELGEIIRTFNVDKMAAETVNNLSETVITTAESFVTYAEAESRAKTAASAPPSLEVEPCQKMLLDISVTAPEIRIPINETSRDMAIFNLGKVVVNNSYSFDSTNGLEFQTVVITLDELKVDTEIAGVAEHLVEDIAMSMALNMIATQDELPTEEIPGSDITLEIESLPLSITQRQIDFIFPYLSEVQASFAPKEENNNEIQSNDEKEKLEDKLNDNNNNDDNNNDDDDDDDDSTLMCMAVPPQTLKGYLTQSYEGQAQNLIMKFIVKKVSIDLKTEVDEPLSSFTMSNLSGDVTVYNTNFVDVHAGIEKMHMTDTRKGSQSVFRNLIECQTDMKGKKFIDAHYVLQTKTSDMAVAAELNSFHIAFTPTLITEVENMVLVPLSRWRASSLAVPDEAALAAEEQRLRAEAEAEEKRRALREMKGKSSYVGKLRTRSGMHAEARLGDVVLTVTDSETDPRACCFEMTVNGAVQYTRDCVMEDTASVALESFGLRNVFLRDGALLPGEGEDVLVPSTVKATYRTALTKDPLTTDERHATKTVLGLALEEFAVRMSSGMLKSLLVAAKYVMNLSDLPVSPEEAEILKATEEVRKKWKEKSNNIDKENENEKEERSDDSTHIGVRFGKFSLTLIDDFREVSGPILDVLIDGTEATMDTDRRGTSLSTDMVLEMNFYNRGVAEHFIEPWKMSFALTPGDDPARPQQSTTIASDEPFNVVISYACVDALLAYYAALEKELPAIMKLAGELSGGNADDADAEERRRREEEARKREAEERMLAVPPTPVEALEAMIADASGLAAAAPSRTSISLRSLGVVLIREVGDPLSEFAVKGLALEISSGDVTYVSAGIEEMFMTDTRKDSPAFFKNLVECQPDMKGKKFLDARYVTRAKTSDTAIAVALSSFHMTLLPTLVVEVENMVLVPLSRWRAASLDAPDVPPQGPSAQAAAGKKDEGEKGPEDIKVRTPERKFDIKVSNSHTVADEIIRELSKEYQRERKIRERDKSTKKRKGVAKRRGKKGKKGGGVGGVVTLQLGELAGWITRHSKGVLTKDEAESVSKILLGRGIVVRSEGKGGDAENAAFILKPKSAARYCKKNFYHGREHAMRQRASMKLTRTVKSTTWGAKAGRQRVRSGLLVKVDFSSVNFTVTEDERKEDGFCFTLTADGAAAYCQECMGTDAVYLDIRPVEIASYNHDRGRVPALRDHLLLPCTAVLDYRTGPIEDPLRPRGPAEKLHTRTDIDLTLKEMNLNMSYMMLKGTLLTLKTLMPLSELPMSDEEKDKLARIEEAKKRAAAAKAAEKAASENLLISSDSSDNDISDSNCEMSDDELGIDPAEEAPPGDVFTEEEADVEDITHVSAIMNRISVVLLNNFEGRHTPLLWATVENVSLEMDMLPDVTSLDLISNVSAQFFNENIVLWEPLIEPWTFRLLMRPNEDIALPRNTTLLTSKMPLNINLSQVFLESSGRLYHVMNNEFSKIMPLLTNLSAPIPEENEDKKEKGDIIDDDDESDPGKKREGHCGLWVVDRTGLGTFSITVTYKVRETGEVVPSSIVERPIPGALMPIPVDADVLTRHAGRTIVRIGTITHRPPTGAAPAVISSIRLDRVGVLVHPGIVEGEAILTKVEWEDNEKVLTICSAGVVVNNTEYPLDVTFHSEYRERSVRVPSKGKFPIPIGHLEAAKMYVKCKDHSQSTEGFSVDAEPGSVHVLKCRSHADAQCCRFFYVKQVAPTDPDSDSDPTSAAAVAEKTTISIFAPMALTNLLPCAARVSFAYKSKKKRSEEKKEGDDEYVDVGTIARGETRTFYQFDPARDIRIRVSDVLPGVLEPAVYTLKSKKVRDGTTFDDTFAARDAKLSPKESLDFTIRAKFTPTKELTVFVPTWIRNQTRMAICVQDGAPTTSSGALSACCGEGGVPPADIGLGDKRTPFVPFLCSSSKIRIRPAGCDVWSTAFDAAVEGQSGVVEIEDKKANVVHRFKVVCRAVSAPFNIVKRVVISPGFVVVSKLPGNAVLNLRQPGSDEPLAIRGPGHIPLHFRMRGAGGKKALDPLLKACVNDGKMHFWSGPFAIDSVGNYTLRLRTRNPVKHCDYYLRYEVVDAMYTTFVIFKEERVDAIPFKIVNDTPFLVTFAQARDAMKKKNGDEGGGEGEEEGDGGKGRKGHKGHKMDTVVYPKSSEYFGYDDLVGSPNVLAQCEELFGKGERKKFNITKIRPFKPFKDQNGYLVYSYVFTSGPMRVLVLTYSLLQLEKDCPSLKKRDIKKRRRIASSKKDEAKPKPEENKKEVVMDDKKKEKKEQKEKEKREKKEKKEREKKEKKEKKKRKKKEKKNYDSDDDSDSDSDDEDDSEYDDFKDKDNENENGNGNEKEKENDNDTIEDEIELLEQSTQIIIQSVSVSFITKKSEDFLLLTVQGLFLDISTTTQSQTYEARVQSIQLDNMSTGKATYPVVLYGGPNPEAKTNEERQWLRVSVVKSVLYEDMDYYTYAGMLIQDVVLNLDMHFLSDILDFTGSVPFDAFSSAQDPSSLTPEQQRVLGAVTEWETLHENVTISNESQDRMCYFEILHLNPVKITLTFTSTVGSIPGMPPFRGASIVEAIINTTGNLEKVPLKFNALLLENPFCPASTLSSMITSHYVHSMVVQALKLGGSFDLLGNPVGLFSNIGTGVMDFFYEPAQGLCQSPKDFGKGMAKGSKSLVKNTVYGVFNTLSKVTGTLGKGVANLTLDDEYIRKREASHMHQSKHVGDGLAKGMYALGRGVFDGVTGVVVQPIKGARKEGAKGFAKGVGKGVIGVAAKPMAGAFELVSKTTEGVKNTTTVFEDEIAPVRKYPRVFGDEGEILPYYAHDAEGAFIVSSTPELAGHRYYKHVNFRKGRIVFTNNAVAVLGKINELKAMIAAKNVGILVDMGTEIVICDVTKKDKVVVKLTDEEVGTAGKKTVTQNVITSTFDEWKKKYGPDAPALTHGQLNRVGNKKSRMGFVKKTATDAVK